MARAMNRIEQDIISRLIIKLRMFMHLIENLIFNTKRSYSILIIIFWFDSFFPINILSRVSSQFILFLTRRMLISNLAPTFSDVIWCTYVYTYAREDLYNYKPGKAWHYSKCKLWLTMKLNDVILWDFIIHIFRNLEE